MKPAATAFRRVYQAVGVAIGSPQRADSKAVETKDRVTNNRTESDSNELPPTAGTVTATVTESTEESFKHSSAEKSSNEITEEINEVEVETTRNGNAEINHTDGRSRRKRKPSLDPFLITEEPRKVKAKPKKKKKVDPEDEFESFWICCECKEAECMMKPEADQLLICEGTCRRLFHYPCAGLAELPAEDAPYICSDCTSQRHPCAICQEYGHDDEDVFVCSKDECGLFFHEHCLVMQNVEVQVNQEEEAKIVAEQRDEIPAKGSASRKAAKRHFVCPAHWCWTCSQRDEQEKEIQAEKEAAASKKKGGRKKKPKPKNNAFECKSGGRIIRCLECPTSYHITCIPPTARFHELAMLCHEHAATHKLPELDPETSIQGTIEKQIDEKFTQLEMKRQRIRQAKGDNLFFPGMHGNKFTKKETKLIESFEKEGDSDSDNLWFCLPCDLKDEVHSKPPSYRHVHSLRYDPENRPSKIPASGDICDCVGFCGEDCLNRMLYVECSGDASKNAGGRKYSNCKVGITCGNRKIGQRKFAKCAPKREQGKGWGLIAQEPLMKGDLVLEYVGEVIDAKMKEKRLQEWTAEHPNDPNFYIMSLRDQWFIDARHEANLSRFINHSCEPNCILMQINVGGFIRNGIFAIRDICEGEFLSYDYHFDTRHADQFACRCGSLKCRGTMKGGASTLPSAKKSQKEIWEEAKGRYERDKKFLEEYYEREKTRHTQVAATVPAAENKDETVANGVQERYIDEVKMHRIFLWRNALQGSDFSGRLERLQGKS